MASTRVSPHPSSAARGDPARRDRRPLPTHAERRLNKYAPAYGARAGVWSRSSPSRGFLPLGRGSAPQFTAWADTTPGTGKPHPLPPRRRGIPRPSSSRCTGSASPPRSGRLKLPSPAAEAGRFSHSNEGKEKKKRDERISDSEEQPPRCRGARTLRVRYTHFQGDIHGPSLPPDRPL
jgi:hypothetical protein